MSQQTEKVLQFPPALVSRADLARLVREIEDVDNDLEAQKARNHATGKTGYKLPNLSRTMSDFVELNSVDMANDQVRMHLKEQMKRMKDKAPIVHMTFATEADPASLQKLVAYLRTEIHPQALLIVGLQPSLIGGVYLRTPNHVHDFSVRAKLAEKRGVILQDLEELSYVIKVVEAPPETPEEIAAREQAEKLEKATQAQQADQQKAAEQSKQVEQSQQPEQQKPTEQPQQTGQPK